MTVLNRARVFGVGVTGLAAVLIACSGGTSVGSKYVKTVSVGAAGATISVATSDDPTIAGTKIVIPANALSTTTTITIGIDASNINPTGTTTAGPVVDFEPSGTKFAVPVTITLPVTLPAGVSSSRLFVEALEAGGETSRLAASYVAGFATFHANGFTDFGGCIAPAGSDASLNCIADSDCAAGQVCNSGICVGGVSGDGGTDATFGCSDNTECPAGEQCVDGFCGFTVDASVIDGGPAACATDADCPSGEQCFSGECFAESFDAGADASFNPDAADAAFCGSDSDCPGGDTCCSGVCADLQNDNDSCGGCDMACSSGTTCAAGVCHS